MGIATEWKDCPLYGYSQRALRLPTLWPIAYNLLASFPTQMRALSKQLMVDYAVAVKQLVGVWHFSMLFVFGGWTCILVLLYLLFTRFWCITALYLAWYYYDLSLIHI